MKSGDEPICVDGYAFMATPGKPPERGSLFIFTRTKTRLWFIYRGTFRVTSP